MTNYRPVNAMSCKNSELSLGARTLGQGYIISAVSTELGISRLAALNGVQTLAAGSKIVVDSHQHHIREILRCPASLRALFIFLCFFTLGIYLIYSLVTRQEQLNKLSMFAVKELTTIGNADRLAEAQIAAAADGLLLFTGEEKSLSDLLCKKISDLSEASAVSLSACKIPLTDGADYARALREAAELLNITLKKEKMEGDEEGYLLRLENLRPTKATVERWNGLVDLLD
ncbi:MAG: DUF4234 domain-containing protein, partial [Puniceicoccales bacterium]|nr:DUF4234 domain-containing protein [Puniceicoccales bacterium]